VCSVVIRPIFPNDVNPPLAVAEIKLYAADDTQIAPLSAQLSSEYGIMSNAAAAVDNNLATAAITADEDPAPMLTVKYRCPGGQPADRVMVYSCSPRCNGYLGTSAMDFVDGSGQVDPLLTIALLDEEPVITVPGRRG
jgi:hypothetical protein